MSNAELREYFLKHRKDEVAFQAYLNRINQRPLRLIASLNDPDFDEKVQIAIRQKLEVSINGSNHPSNTALEAKAQVTILNGISMTDNVQNDILNEYDNSQIILRKLEKKVKELLQDLLEPNKANIHTISSRIKSRDSLNKKIELKNKYSYLRDITDIVGFRVITLFSDTVDEIAKIIESEFKIDKQNYIDKRKALDSDRFGYLSLHYIAYLSDSRSQLPENALVSNFCFEIQIRSILQHTWAEIEHDLGYKSKNSSPQAIQRRLYRLAALLEVADEEFKHLRNAIDDYKVQVEDSINKNNLNNVRIDIESIKEFIQREPLVKQISQTISNKTKLSLLENQKVESQTIEYLFSSGYSTLEEIKRDLERYREQIIKFTVLWINENGRKNIGYITCEVALIRLSYIKLALIGNAPDIIERLKLFPLYINTEEEFKQLAARILKTYKEINPSNL
ncbi:GTP pyrophosphokinase [Nostoc sp.]|uniref:GTP pyrophosphokinase n=1 Tax=Nostoc sp. TaxID=1180 RepID=UPI002FF7424F